MLFKQVHVFLPTIYTLADITVSFLSGLWYCFLYRDQIVEVIDQEIKLDGNTQDHWVHEEYYSNFIRSRKGAHIGQQPWMSLLALMFTKDSGRQNKDEMMEKERNWFLELNIEENIEKKRTKRKRMKDLRGRTRRTMKGRSSLKFLINSYGMVMIKLKVLLINVPILIQCIIIREDRLFQTWWHPMTKEINVAVRGNNTGCTADQWIVGKTGWLRVWINMAEHFQPYARVLRRMENLISTAKKEEHRHQVTSSIFCHLCISMLFRIETTLWGRLK